MNKKNRNIIIVITGCIIVVIVVFILYVGFAPIKCKTKDCFVGHAKYCNAAVLNIEEEIGTVKYESSYEISAPIESSCTLTKTIVKLHESESMAMKDLLEEKSTYCYYNVGGVNPDWVYSLVSGLDECEYSGGLKEAIGKLILFAE